MFYIGFTGTKTGMTKKQKDSVTEILKFFIVPNDTQTIHGGCVGADIDFHGISRSLSIDPIVYPSDIKNMHGKWDGAKEVFPEMKPLDRNRIIVDRSDIMISTPYGTFEEVRGSGTWATIRYSRRVKKPMIVVFPDGSTRPENFDRPSVA